MDHRRLAVMSTGFLCVALMSSALNIFDFFTGSFTEVDGRAAGLFGNPNSAGHAIAFAMACSPRMPKMTKAAFTAFCGLAILVTFSRQAWLLWCLAVAMMFYQGQFGGSRRSRVLLLAAALVVGGGILALLFSGGLGALLADTSLASYLNPDTLQRLGVSSGVLAGESSAEREMLARLALQQGAEAPVIGHGLGYAMAWGDARPHNMFLLFFLEQGLVGVTLFAAFLVLLWTASRGQGRIVAALFIVTGMFTHNLFEQPEFMTYVAFIVAHGALWRIGSVGRNPAVNARKDSRNVLATRGLALRPPLLNRQPLAR
jgi:hypothetical protein